MPSAALTNGGAAAQAKLSKNAKRRQKKKEERASSAAPSEASSTPAPEEAKVNGASGSSNSILDQAASGEGSRSSNGAGEAASSSSSALDFALPTDPEDETYKAFADVFKRFAGGDVGGEGEEGGETINGKAKGEVIYSDDDMLSEDEAEGKAKGADQQPLSKKKAKKLQRLTVAELKQMAKKPEVVDWEDVTAPDPRLLVTLKSTRNTVGVPPHWNQKRDYLQNKRGIEKPPFELPSYIADTGILEMKDSLKEREGEQTLKAQMRARVQPKMGKVDVDYQKLHDAFFRFQRKPDNLTSYGETYYEGKENETKFKERRPGELSEELKEALSIPPLAPPPWLIAMQRFGPPPSYPHLKIAGLNAPIPEGAQWGFHPGGWGRPPMDEYGQPLYADVLGSAGAAALQAEQEALGEPVQREPWGELEPEEEEEEEEEEDEEDEEEEEEEQDQTPVDGLQTPSGLETPGGFQSVTSTVPGGLETPDFIELRKGGRGGTASVPRPEREEQEVARPKALFQELPERQAAPGNGGREFMASDHTYDLSAISARAAPGGQHAVIGAEERGTKRKAGSRTDVALSLDPSELEGMSEAELAERYESARRAQNASLAGTRGTAGGATDEELALLRDELARKRRVKEARRAGGGGGDADAKGRFKF